MPTRDFCDLCNKQLYESDLQFRIKIEVSERSGPHHRPSTQLRIDGKYVTIDTYKPMVCRVCAEKIARTMHDLIPKDELEA